MKNSFKFSYKKNNKDIINLKENRIDSIIDNVKINKKSKNCCKEKEKTNKNNQIEIIVLEEIITKIATLTAIGLGENGSNII